MVGDVLFTHKNTIHILADLDNTGDIFDEAISAIGKETRDKRGYYGMLEIAKQVPFQPLLFTSRIKTFVIQSKKNVLTSSRSICGKKKHIEGTAIPHWEQ